MKMCEKLLPAYLEWNKGCCLDWQKPHKEEVGHQDVEYLGACKQYRVEEDRENEMLHLPHRLKDAVE